MSILLHSILLIPSFPHHLPTLLRSGDDRFLKQFKAGDLKAKFKPYSKYPACWKVGLRATHQGLIGGRWGGDEGLAPLEGTQVLHG